MESKEAEGKWDGECERKREGELFLITLHSKQAPNGNLLQVATSIVVPQLVSSLKRCLLCSSLSLFSLTVDFESFHFSVADTAGLPQMAMFISHNDAAAPSTTGKICCLTCVSHPSVCLTCPLCLLRFASCGRQLWINYKFCVPHGANGKQKYVEKRRKAKQSKARGGQRKVSHPGLTLRPFCLALAWPLTLSFYVPLSPFISLSVSLSSCPSFASTILLGYL